VREPVPTDLERLISVNGLTMPAEPVAEHSHPGQTIAYLVTGEVETGCSRSASDPQTLAAISMKRRDNCTR
jgi:hypothetical protein